MQIAITCALPPALSQPTRSLQFWLILVYTHKLAVCCTEQHPDSDCKHFVSHLVSSDLTDSIDLLLTFMLSMSLMPPGHEAGSTEPAAVHAGGALTCSGWKRPVLTQTLSMAAPAGDIVADCWACGSWAVPSAACAPSLPAFAVVGLSASSAAHSCGDDTLLQAGAEVLGAASVMDRIT